MIELNNLDFEKLDGLIPAIVLDKNTDKVLMLGFMNEESLKKTIETKKVTFYSRSRKEIWTKGETSGNYLNLVDIKVDCDNDTLLVSAVPDGNTCHKNTYSCFDVEQKSLKFFETLFELVKERKQKLPKDSYTTSLFNKGENRIIQKVGEEAVEVLIAAKNNDKEEIINETSDLIYHLFVMLVEKNIDIYSIVKKLEERHNK